MFKSIVHRSLNFKIMAAVSLAFLLVLGISFSLLLSYQRRQLVNNAQESINHLSNTIMGAMEHSMLTNRLDEVEKIVETVAKQKGINKIRILDKEGEIRISSCKDVGERTDLSDPTCQLCHKDISASRNKTVIFALPTGEKVLRNVNPIVNKESCQGCHDKEQKILGTIIMDVSASRIDRELSANFKGLLLSALATLICLILIIYLVSTRFVTFPIKRLVKGTQEIGSGNLEYRVEKDSQDEIGELIGSFNTMTGDLQDSREEITRKVIELERKNTELSTMYNVVQSITSTLDIEELKRVILSTILEILHADLCYLILFDEEEDKAVFNIKDKGKEEIESFEVDSFQDMDRYAAFADPVSSKLRSYLPFLKGPRDDKSAPSFLFAPLEIHNERIGLVFAVREPGDTFLESDSGIFLALSRNLAMSIRHATLYRLAITDSLTNLYIKRYFKDRLEEEVKRAKRYHTQLSLIIMDFDNFKVINDNYGHPVGDIVLKRIAETIKNNIRSTDIAARYGGDEFAVIMPETGADGAKIAAEKIRKNLADHPLRLSDGLRLTVTVSIGLVVMSEEEDTSDGLIASADEAMYKAKKLGRNRVIYAGN